MVWLEEFLKLMIREAKLKWEDVNVKLIKLKKSRVEIHMVIRGEKVKLILYNDGRVWVVSRLTGLNIALKRISQRILEKVRGIKSEE